MDTLPTNYVARVISFLDMTSYCSFRCCSKKTLSISVHPLASPAVLTLHSKWMCTHESTIVVALRHLRPTQVLLLDVTPKSWSIVSSSPAASHIRRLKLTQWNRYNAVITTTTTTTNNDNNSDTKREQKNSGRTLDHLHHLANFSRLEEFKYFSVSCNYLDINGDSVFAPLQCLTALYLENITLRECMGRTLDSRGLPPTLVTLRIDTLREKNVGTKKKEENLKCKDPRPSTISAWQQYCGSTFMNLKHFHVVTPNNNNAEPYDLKHMNDAFPLLETLHLMARHLPSIPSFAHLTCLCCDLRPDNLAAVLALPVLTSFAPFTDSETTTQNVFQTWSRVIPPPHITRLNIEWCEGFTNECLESVVGNAPSLVYLDLSHSDVSNLTSLSKVSKTLRILGVSVCHALRVAGYGMVEEKDEEGKHLPLLTDMELAQMQCRNHLLPDYEFNETHFPFSSLETVYVWRWHRISQAIIRNRFKHVKFLPGPSPVFF